MEAIGAPPPIWPPVLLAYGIIIGSLSLLGVLAHARFAPFRAWLAAPINVFWFAWIQLVVCSGATIAMMLFPDPLADGSPMGWGRLKYDGAFKGPAWIAANEIQTQIIVLCFTLSALLNHPPVITELYVSYSHPAEIERLFPRPRLTMAQRRAFLLLANANCVFMYPLTFSTWMIPVERRSFLYTAVFLPLSLGSGIAAGVYLALRAGKAESAGPAEVAVKREQSQTLIETFGGKPGAREEHDDQEAQASQADSASAEAQHPHGGPGQV